MASGNSNAGGTSLPTLLFVVFLVLKLTDKIDWSWWWVTSPLWIPAAVAVAAFGVVAAVVAFAR